MQTLLKQIAEVDPGFASTLRRNQRRTRIYAAIALLAIAGTAYAIVVNFEQGTEIRKVQSACTVHPGGEQCAQTRARTARQEPIKNPCTSFQRVTGERGRNCHHFFVDPDRHGAAESPVPGPSRSSAPGAAGGPAPAAPSGPSPASGGGGKAHAPRHEAPTSPSPAAPEPPAPDPAAPPAPEGGGGGEEEAAPPPAEKAPAGSAGVGAAVAGVDEGTEQIVGGAIEGVGTVVGGTCAATKPTVNLC